MRKIKVQDAVGKVLCHDITRIVPGEFKGPAFRKGHVIRPEDVKPLLELGKDHIYIWDCPPHSLHENEAANRIARAVKGKGIACSDPVEGKVNFLALHRGLLKVDIKGLTLLNSINQVILSTLHNNSVVEEGKILAGTRVIPLIIDKGKIDQAEQLCRLQGPLLEVKEIRPLKVGLITTGNEVYHGRIEDRFSPVLKEKLTGYGCEVVFQEVLPDQVDQIRNKIREMIGKGAGLVLITGGMSVDPDDVTPSAIRESGAQVVVYGVPVLPGSMFMMAYLEGVPVMGLPACAMFFKITVFDLVLPRVLAGESLSRGDFAQMGHGGLCAGCPECGYPHCPFGK
ncbi:MAG: hypothetical protein JL50_15965 [Peptococcaceae bacterium BICA1-7]|nr:MAG: hypothetical protein JL50_15965 [Peptococcaceae bacterium BICA1-7]HBV96713.1 molybdopterin-binding protein [Desulfotomaculum sp.]